MKGLRIVAALVAALLVLMGADRWATSGMVERLHRFRQANSAVRAGMSKAELLRVRGTPDYPDGQAPSVSCTRAGGAREFRYSIEHSDLRTRIARLLRVGQGPGTEYTFEVCFDAAGRVVAVEDGVVSY